MTDHLTLKQEIRDLAQEGQEFIKTIRARGGNMTPGEQKQVQANVEAIQAKENQFHVARAKHSSDVVNRITAGGPEEIPDGPLNGGPGAKAGARGWAKSVAGGLKSAGAGMGVKSLLSGQVSTPSAVEVAPLPSTPTRLLDLVARENLDENTFAYLRQVARTNNAAIVADNALKPTSVHTIEEIEDRARVIAHLSEPFPVRFADDHASMVQVLDGQMQAGLFETIEDLIVNGSGAGEEWEGILNTTGTTQVAFVTDFVTTLRRSRTTLENAGVPVTAIAMNPTDIENLDLLREDGATGGFLLDTDAYERIFGPGVKGVPSLAVPAGQAIVGDFNAISLKVRQAAHTLAATQSGDLFDKNQMKLRTEGRYGFKFTQPGSLAVVDLEAA